MDKSIELIWKEGFLDTDKMVAPKLNNLYSRKSQHTTEKFMRMGKLNLIGVAVLAFLLLTGSIYLGVPYIGCIIFMLLAVAFVYGIKRLKEMNQLDSSLDTYHYLRAFDDFIKETIAGYTKMYRFVYPAVTLAILQGTWSLGGFKERFTTGASHDYLVNDMPVPVLVGMLSFAALTALFAGPIYRFDLNLFYGGIFKKLGEILEDMEELRS